MEKTDNVVDLKQMKTQNMLAVLDEVRSMVVAGDITSLVIAADTTGSNVVTAIGIADREQFSTVSLLGALQILMHRIASRHIEL